MLLTRYFRKICQVGKYSTSQKFDFKGGNTGLDPNAILSDAQLSFQDVFYMLHYQARRTMLLYLKTDPSSDQNYVGDQIQSFCSSFDKVLYCKSVETCANYFLVEFSSLDGIQNLSSHSKEGMLMLRMAELSPTNLDLNPAFKTPKVHSEASTGNSLSEELRNASTISDQICLYYHSKRASSDNVRKKLFLPSLFQDFFNWHMKTDVTSIPFGTSFSSFSTESSDVDISLTHLSDALSHPNVSITSLNQLPTKTAQMYKSLQRAGTNALFTEASKHIDKYLPGVKSLTSFDAMFPLISFYFSPFEIPVEISFNNRPGVQSSWMINMYTRNDERVAPFLFLIREWGKQTKATKHGGAYYDGLTPYMLTCLGLFYLMRCQPCVLPSMMDMFEKKSKNSDIIMGGFRTKFKNNSNVPKTSNTDSLEKLLMGFFQYYRKFDFQNKSVNLARGRAGPSYYNTLDLKIPFTSQNAGKGCSLRNLKNFKHNVESALLKLEAANRRNSNWGILSLIDTK